MSVSRPDTTNKIYTKNILVFYDFYMFTNLMNLHAGRFFVIASFSASTVILCFGILQILYPTRQQPAQVALYYQPTVEQRRQECALKISNQSLQMHENVNCTKLFNADFDEICVASRIHRSMDDSVLLKQLANCRIFRKSRYKMPRQQENLNFSIAYVILMHGTSILQLEKLLRLIYNSHNFYCIHPDTKSIGLLEKVKQLAHCFENVKIPTKLHQVFWGGISVLLATLACMETLLEINAEWRYFINLSAQDFPLKTQKEIAQFLQRLNGKNHAEIGVEIRKYHYEFHHEIVYDFHGFPSEIRRTSQRKSPPPHNLTIYKGNLAAILHRSFCEWIRNSSVALDLLEWLQDTDTPDEHYWATLLENRQLSGAGGIYQPENFLGRYAVWKPNQKCRGKFVRDVCVFGAEDAQNLVKQPQLFANKFYCGFETPAFECMELWLMNKLN